MKLKLSGVIALLVLVTSCATNVKKRSLEDIQKEIEQFKVEDNKASKNKNVNKYWNIRFYVDDFGKKTNEGYISLVDYVKGTFSNSATENSKLYVDIIADEDSFGIQLFEYSKKSPVKGYLEQLVYTIKIREENGKEHEVYGDLWKGGNRISVKNHYVNKIHDLLKEGNKLIFLIEGVKFKNKYLFTLDGKYYGYHYRNLLKSKIK